MKRPLYVIGASLIGAGLLLSACATTGGASDANPPAGNNAASPSKTAQVESKQGDQLKFGQSYTWDDGVTLTVSKGSAFKPGEYSKVKGAKAYIKYSVKVVNKSKKPLDLGLTYITVQSGPKEAEQVYDSENGLEGAPSTKLLAGREANFDVGFGVAKPSDVVMEVSLQDSFDRPSVIYTTG